MSEGNAQTFEVGDEERIAQRALGPIVVAMNLMIGAVFLALDEPFLAALDGIAALIQVIGSVMVFRGAISAGLWTIFVPSIAHIFFWVGALGLEGGWGYYVLNCILAFYVALRVRRGQLYLGYTLVVVGLLISVPIALLVPHPWTFDARTTWMLHAFNLSVVVAGQLFGLYMSRRLAANAERELVALREEVEEIRRLGQYTLGAKIGEGGMGQVYRASHALLRRPAALKLVRQGDGDEAAMRRFEREVQLTSELTCPNTIEIYDYGRTPEGVFYYVMELLDGLDLQTLVERDGPQPCERVVYLLVQICEALEEAHARGLVHRDIKPANLMLCWRGLRPDVIKVLDFGLVKDLSGNDATREDVLAGTPAYLSPEAIEDPESVGPKSDLYAVGAVGYYLLTGAHVFSGKTLAAICAAHLHERPEPPSERLGTPVDEVLEELLLDCLQKDAAHRPRDARALRDALSGIELDPPWTERDARVWWRTHEAREPKPPTRMDEASAEGLSMTIDLRAPRAKQRSVS